MIADIVTRLGAQSKPPLKTIDKAAGFAAIEENPNRNKLPVAYVFPLTDRGGPNQVATGVVQKLDTRFGVAMAVGSLMDRSGGDATDNIETVYKSVRAALVGWQPASAKTSIKFGQGRMLLMQGGLVWWLDEFTTTESLRSV